MIENYIKEADRVTYLMPKEVDHHCAGQIIAELDALIEGCGVRKIVFDMKQTEFMDSSGIGVIIGRTKKLKYFNDSARRQRQMCIRDRYWSDNRKNKEA